MDTLSMLANAKITDLDGDDIGEVIAVHYVNGKLYLTVDLTLADGEEDDPDGGEEIDEDDERELKDTEEVPQPTPLRAVVGGRK